MRVRAVLAEALRLHHVSRGVWDARTRAALGDAGLEADDRLLSSFPHELSGGQRQRVAIARAIVTNPRLVVADEPTSMLDAALRAEIARLVRRMADDHGVGVLLITHDRGEAAQVADTVVVLNAGAVVSRSRSRSRMSESCEPFA